MGISELSAKELVLAGGPIMIPIALCSIFAVAIILEKMITFSTFLTNTDKLKLTVFNLIKDNKIKEAINTCETNRSLLANILKAGLLKYGSPREAIQGAMESSSAFEIPKFEERLAALKTIIHISPLLGLLGTITGMAISFYTLQSRSASMDPITMVDLAGGMWQALITTMAGLIVAIPALVAYNYFINRIDYFTLEMERSASEILDLICQTTEGQRTISDETA